MAAEIVPRRDNLCGFNLTIEKKVKENVVSTLRSRR